MAAIVPKKDGAAVTPFLPPGGVPLMTGSLETGETTFQKQQHYLLQEVEEKLNDIVTEQDYEQKKIILFIWCTLSGLGGAFLVMYALGLTVLFAVSVVLNFDLCVCVLISFLCI